MGTSLATTTQDVLTLFSGQPGAVAVYDSWLEDPRRRGVQAVVLPLVSRAVYSITAAQVKTFNTSILNDSNKRSPWVPGEKPSRSLIDWPVLDPDALHPLGHIESANVYEQAGYRQKEVVNWSAPLAFNHVFHYLLEKRGGKLFTYPDLRIACRDDPVLNALLTASAWQLFRQLDDRTEATAELLYQCFRWRVGCAYYSFLRELYVFAVLRDEMNMDLRVHPLADTLFRTDFWGDGTAVELFVKNDTYKGNKRGRKAPMERYTSSIFPVRWRIRLDPPRIFGCAYLPEPKIIRENMTRVVTMSDGAREVYEEAPPISSWEEEQLPPDPKF